MDRAKLVQVKAGYLVNFARFTTWPTEAFEAEDAPLVIGVTDDEAVAELLERTVTGRAIGGHPLKVRRLGALPPTGAASSWRRLDERLRDCHMVYCAQASEDRETRLLQALAGMPVLTVGEGEAYATRGGMLGFMLDEGRVIFCANPKAIQAAALSVSSRVLKLARIVTPEKEGRP